MSFRNVLSRIGDFLDVVDAAISASAALRAHRAPAGRDLARLGISADAKTVAAMAHY